MSDDDIGPTLPPGMSRGRKDNPRTHGTDRDSELSIGPTLPPHLKSAPSLEQTSSRRRDDGQDSEFGMGTSLPHQSKGRLIYPNKNCNDEDSEENIGPSLPPHLRKHQSPESSLGPVLPPVSTKKDTDDDEDDDDDDMYGPSLPPAYTSRQTDVIGPSLPSGFRRPFEERDGDNSDEAEESEDESSEEEVIGPMPASVSDYVGGRTAAEELEARAAAMKNKLTTREEDVQSRETWMTELPEFSKSFGMGPRTFRKNARPDEKDRSGWTETPADRARKQQERMERAAAEQASSSSKPSKKNKKKKKKDKEGSKMSERDLRMAEEVDKHNKRARSETLMDIHTKKRKQKLMEKGEEGSERRPFDRDNDLQVNRFDDARKKQLMKKSAHLGEKFSHSTEKMYL